MQAINPHRRIRDILAADIGLLRIMYRNAGQVDMRPPLQLIESDIREAWQLSAPADQQALRDLLQSTMPAAGHLVSDFRLLAKLLRRHVQQQSLTAHKELIFRQQRMALPKEKSDAFSSMGGEVPAVPADLLTSRAACEKWLIRFASDHEDRTEARLTWPQFMLAISQVTRSSPGVIDAWQARQHFLSCANAPSTSTAGRSAPVSSLSRVFRYATPINAAVTSLASKSMREALNWENTQRAVGEYHANMIDRNIQRKRTTSVTRSVQLRAAAVAEIRKKEREADLWKADHRSSHRVRLGSTVSLVPQPPPPALAVQKPPALRPRTAR